MQTKSLLVKVGADTKEMERGLTSARGKMKDFTGRIQKMSRGMVVAGAAITAAVGLMVKGYVQAGDEVHKMSLRTGFGTEALSELKYAAELSGTSLATLEKGIKKMASTIGEAKKGTKTYTDAFALIGLEVKELDGLKPEETFMKMAEGIAGLADANDRAYAAQMLLGRAGTELLPLFAAGAEGIEAMRQEARDLGITFTELAARKAAALNDSMLALKKSFQGITHTLAESLLPILTTYSGKITEIVKKTNEWADAHPKVSAALGQGVPILGGALLTLGGMGLVLPKIVIGFQLLKGAALGLGPIFWSIAAGAAAAYGAVKLLEKLRGAEVLDEQTKAYKRITEVIGFWSDFEDAAVKAGVARREDLIKIWDKYEQNTQDTLSAIATGTEGQALQKFLSDLTKGHSDALVMAGKHGEKLEDVIEKPAKAIVKTGPVFTSWATRVAQIFHDTSVRAAEMRAKMKDIKLILPPVAVDMPKMSLEDWEDWLKQWHEDLNEKWAKEWQEKLNIARYFVDQLSAIFSQFSAGQMQRIDNEYEARRTAIENSLMDEEAKVTAMEKLDKEMDAKRRKALRTQAIFQKAVSLASAFINIAEAVTKTYAVLGPFGIPMATWIKAMGALQIAAIAATPIPSLETGGFVPKETLAHLHPGEYVLSAPDVKAMTAPGGMASSSPFPNRLYNDITVVIGGERFKQSVVRVINEASEGRELRIRQHSVVN